MPRDLDRRSFMKAVGAAAGTAALGPQITSAQTSEDRFVVDTSNVTTWAMDWDIIHDLSEVDLAVIEAEESAIPDSVDYAPDLEWEREVPAGPVTAEDVEEDLAEVAPESAFDETYAGFQWDKREQGLDEAHKISTGNGTRVAVIDSGIYEDHPDLAANVNEGLSKNFTGDGLGPFAVSDDHGTHVAGIIGARDNGAGVIGHAPEAELLSLRVFSPTGAAGDVMAAVMYAANKNCDIANLSLGIPPLFVDDDDPDDASGAIINVGQRTIDFFQKAYSRVGRYAVENGCLPIAAAGNDAYNASDDLKDYFGKASTWDGGSDGTLAEGDLAVFPAEADGFMSISATGPIGFLWGKGGNGVSDAELELPTYEPAAYTNFGSEAVDVSASGGNFEAQAAEAFRANGSPSYYYDLVFNTVFSGDKRKGTRRPSYGWIAGTSMACPTVSGLAALVKANQPMLDPEQIRATIEKTAVQLPVGADFADGAGETAAPIFRNGKKGQNINSDSDGDTKDPEPDWDGDTLSAPDLESGTPKSRKFRGNGHINTLAALTTKVRQGRGTSTAGAGETNGGDAPGGDAPAGDGERGDNRGRSRGDGGGGGGT